jgi:hypothetical protein
MSERLKKRGLTNKAAARADCRPIFSRATRWMTEHDCILRGSKRHRTHDVSLIESAIARYSARCAGCCDDRARRARVSCPLLASAYPQACLSIWGCGLNDTFPALSARSIMRVKPVVVNGASRSDVNTSSEGRSSGLAHRSSPIKQQSELPQRAERLSLVGRPPFSMPSMRPNCICRVFSTKLSIIVHYFTHQCSISCCRITPSWPLVNSATVFATASITSSASSVSTLSDPPAKNDPAFIPNFGCLEA